MKRLISLLLETALSLGHLGLEYGELNAELIELEQRINTMPNVTQASLDALTADVTANAQAITDVKTFVGTLQSQITTTNAELTALKQQLADDGSPADLSGLETALEAATATAQSITQAAAVVTPPVVPAPVDSTDTAASTDPTAATTDPAATPSDTTGTPGSGV